MSRILFQRRKSVRVARSFLEFHQAPVTAIEQFLAAFGERVVVSRRNLTVVAKHLDLDWLLTHAFTDTDLGKRFRRRYRDKVFDLFGLYSRRFEAKRTPHTRARIVRTYQRKLRALQFEFLLTSPLGALRNTEARDVTLARLRGRITLPDEGSVSAWEHPQFQVPVAVATGRERLRGVRKWKTAVSEVAHQRAAGAYARFLQPGPGSPLSRR